MAAKTKAAKTTATKAGKAAVQARRNPYVQRFMEDEKLRENVRQAFESARSAYRRMSNGKAPAKALMEDKKLQRDLRQASASFRDAAEGMQGKRKRKRRGRRLLFLLVVGGAIAMIASPDLRKKVLDRLFGAEEEFEYTSTTSPA
jgi:type IV secretory pathway VirB10-like protein